MATAPELPSKDDSLTPQGCENLFVSVKAADESLRRLSKVVLDGLRPPAGAYGFFHHSGHAIARVEDIRRIVRRLCEQRAKLTRLAYEEERALPCGRKHESPYSEEVQRIFQEQHETNGYMQLDLESLYVFGTILLDQWALHAIAIGSPRVRGQHPYAELVQFLEGEEPSILSPLWQRFGPRMSWLYYHARFYRNRFVVHADRPWQRGTTRSVYGDDYNLFTPTPPGWLDDRALDTEILSLLRLAPEHFRRLPDHHGEKRPAALLDWLFQHIDTIGDKADRERVAALFGKKGGSTPSFQVIGINLLTFVSEATNVLSEIAAANLATINLGPPHMTSEQMFRQEPAS